MRSRSKNTGYIFLVKRKFFLGVILLSVILYPLAGTGGFGTHLLLPTKCIRSAPK